jgi:glycosyltransferase involved in cell wall biosynthesis
MSRPPPLSIRLVPPLAGTNVSWSLDSLRTELEQAGHDVRVARREDDRDRGAPDVVHLFGASDQDPSSQVGEAPLLVTPSPGVGAIEDPEALPMLAVAASVVVRSSSEQEQVHRLGVPWYRTWVLPVAVDVETYSRVGEMANRTGRFRLVAELSGPADGLEDVIAAVSRLDDVELVVLVDDPGGVAVSERRLAAIKAAMRDAGILDRCVFVAPASAGERAWWLRSAHVAVAVPHAVAGVDFAAQAMSCGTPVVATPVDALADLVVHGVTGFLVGAGEPLSVARAVRKVLEDEFSVEAYGLAASDRAQSRFAWPRVAQELVGVYRRVASPVAEPDDAAATDPTIDEERA